MLMMTFTISFYKDGKKFAESDPFNPLEIWIDYDGIISGIIEKHPELNTTEFDDTTTINLDVYKNGAFVESKVIVCSKNINNLIKRSLP